MIAPLLLTIPGCGGSGGRAGEGEADILPRRLAFNYTIGSDAQLVPTKGGTLHVSIGPQGAHFLPLSGDLLGETKVNSIGYIARYRSEMNELVGTGGDDDGVCNPGESCAY
jgi:hypothetical protein